MTSVVTLCILPNDTYPEAGTIAYPPLLPQSSFCCFSTLVFLLSSPLMEAYSLYPRFSNSHYGLVVKKPLANAGDAGLIPGSGRFPEEGNGNPLQYSYLENPTDRGAWRAAVHEVAKSWTRLSNCAYTQHTHKMG